MSDASIQILEAATNENENFNINEPNLKSVLLHPKCENRKIAIVGVVGTFRKGKSFLLSFLHHYLTKLSEAQKDNRPIGDWLDGDEKVNAFKSSRGIKTFTMGIWFSKEPIVIKNSKGDEIAVILMDTQGLYDRTISDAQCQVLFALSTMISSVQIYNIFDNIDEKMLESLNYFVKYGELMTKKANTKVDFQKLLFCVRDFRCFEEYPPTQEGGDRYLSDVFDSSSSTRSAKEYRAAIGGYFGELGCYLLPIPGPSVTESKSYDGEINKVRPEFLNAIRVIAEGVLGPSNLKEKQKVGIPLTGKTSLEYIKFLIRTFTDGELPRAVDVLKLSARRDCEDIVQKCLEEYESSMQQEACESSEELARAFSLAQKVLALSKYDQKPKLAVPEVVQQFRTKLETEIEARLEEILSSIRTRLEREAKEEELKKTQEDLEKSEEEKKAAEKTAKETKEKLEDTIAALNENSSSCIFAKKAGKLVESAVDLLVSPFTNGPELIKQKAVGGLLPLFTSSIIGPEKQFK